MAKQDDVVEIRIHGVSNTPPENILDIPDGWLVGLAPEINITTPTVRLKQLAGDNDTAIWRPEPEERVEPRSDHRVVAYNWGKLTSGRDRAKKDLQRALWMVLLPFAFMNVAVWTMSASDASRGYDPIGAPRNVRHRVGVLLVRLLALSSTVMFTLVILGVTLDQVVWQWADATPEVGEGQLRRVSPVVGVADVGWLDFVRAGFGSAGARPIAIAGAVSAVVVALVWFVARRSFQYESEVMDVAADNMTDTAGMGGHPLETPTMWQGRRQVAVLSKLHLACALAVITVFTAWPLVGRGEAASTGWEILLTTIAVIAVLVVVACAVLLAAPQLDRLPADRATVDRAPWYPRACLIVELLSAALLGLLLLLLTLTPPAIGKLTGGIPGYDISLTWLVVGQWLAIVMVGVIAVSLRPGFTGAWSVAWGGAGPALMIVVGWLLGLLYGAVTLYYTADYLNGDGEPFGGDPSVLLPRVALLTAALVLPFLALFVCMAVGSLIWVGRRRPSEYADIDTEYGANTPHSRARGRAVATTRAVHRYLDEQAFSVIGALVAWAFVFATAGIAVAFLSDQVRRSSDEAPWGWVDALTGTGARLLLLLAAALALVATQVYRGGSARRVLGIVWDVATFWPRASHPWAPPCYAERVVPQLATYVSHRDPGRGFILAGHSQGSVIAVATMWQLPDAHRRRCALLTFGTQLRGFYGRAFPAYFGETSLLELADQLHDVSPDAPHRLRWRSLWRESDPIGYRIDLAATCGDPGLASHDVDQAAALRDPTSLQPGDDDYVDPPILGHGSYMVDRTFTDVSNELADQLRSP